VGLHHIARNGLTKAFLHNASVWQSRKRRERVADCVVIFVAIVFGIAMIRIVKLHCRIMVKALAIGIIYMQRSLEGKKKVLALVPSQ
jgi:hypothetical protein